MTVGHEDALTAAGEANAGGSPGAAVGGSGGTTSEGSLWSADHEGASFDEWLSDGQGIQFTERQGQLAITGERAHSGSV